MSNEIWVYDSGAGDEEIRNGVNAARAVFEKAGVDLDDVMAAIEKRADGEALDNQETMRCVIFDEADSAAVVACCKGWARIPEAAHIEIRLARMMNDKRSEAKPIVRIVFRMDKSECTAVFDDPEMHAAPNDWASCYSHVGQHSGCSLGWYARTRPAKPAEYKDLLNELRHVYNDCRLIIGSRAVHR